MATITDDDLKMFQERAKTEFASRCDTGGIAWDSVIWDLCNEVRKLRSASKESERGDCAKLREALENSNGLLEELAAIGEWGESAREQIAENNAALSAPPRNCDVGTPEEQYSRMFRECYEWKCMDCKPSKDFRKCALSWAQKPYVKKEGGAK